MIQPNIQIIELKKTKYALLKYSEYEKIMELLEDLEDCKLIDEAIETSEKDYSIEDLEKEYNIKVKRHE